MNYDARPSNGRPPSPPDDAGSAVPWGQMHFGPLAGAADEILSIERLYRAQFDATQITVLKGEEATKSAFLRGAKT